MLPKQFRGALIIMSSNVGEGTGAAGKRRGNIIIIIIIIIVVLFA